MESLGVNSKKGNGNRIDCYGNNLDSIFKVLTVLGRGNLPLFQIVDDSFEPSVVQVYNKNLITK